MSCPQRRLDANRTWSEQWGLRLVERRFHRRCHRGSTEIEEGKKRGATIWKSGTSPNSGEVPPRFHPREILTPGRCHRGATGVRRASGKSAQRFHQGFPEMTVLTSCLGDSFFSASLVEPPGRKDHSRRHLGGTCRVPDAEPPVEPRWNLRRHGWNLR